MNDKIKQLIEFNKKPLHQRLNIQFVNYLKDYEQKKDLIQLAEKIDWKPAVKYFEIEFSKLWNKMAIPNNIEGLEELKNGFASVVLANIRQRLFHFAYTTVKDYSKQKNLIAKKLNEIISDRLDYSMYELFRVFDYQFTLTSLNENNDEKVIIRKINEMKNESHRLHKYKGKKVKEKNLEVYEKILIKNDEYVQRDGEGNFRKAARNVMKNKNTKDFENTYKAFNKFKNNNDLFTHQDFIEYLSTLRE